MIFLSFIFDYLALILAFDKVFLLQNNRKIDNYLKLRVTLNLLFLRVKSNLTKYIREKLN